MAKGKKSLNTKLYAIIVFFVMAGILATITVTTYKSRYNGFSPYGLYIQAIFDSNPDKIGQKIEGKEILDIKTVQDYITKNKIKIAILTIPTEHAQKTADTLVKAGITGIWNFAPVNLNLPKGILCKNQDLAASFITFAQLVK